MPRQHPHLDAGALQAMHDGEGSPARRVRWRLHLTVCAQCAQRSVALRAEAAQVMAILDAERAAKVGVWPDTRDAWQRFVIRSGHRATERSTRRRAGGIILGALVAATITSVLVVAYGRGQSDLMARMYSLSSQGRHTPKGASRRDVEFARRLATLEADGELRRVSDVCCADRDGEGPADDGVLTVSLAGSRSPVVILYEDTQRIGRFQPGDVVLIVSRPGLSAADHPGDYPIDIRE